MQQSAILIKNVFDKYKKAYKSFEMFLLKEVNGFDTNLLPEQIKDNVSNIDFKELRGVLYSFFDKNNILISISPYDIKNKINDEFKCKWQYYINVDNTDIREGEFKKREYAEFISFQKSFQFLDTKLFIEHTSNRFFDERADSSCLNVNWGHLNKVLNYKRKLING